MKSTICQVRHSIVSLTPEEEVRQHFIKQLGRFGFNSIALQCEVDLREYGITEVRGRFDLAIISNEKVSMIFEFKADNIPITHGALQQGINYANSIGAKIVIACNRKSIMAAEKRNNKWVDLECDNAASLRNIISGKVKILKELKWERLRFESFKGKQQHSMLLNNYVIGLDTPAEFVPVISEIHNILLSGVSLAKIKIDKDEIYDLGVSYQYFSNASGGKFPGYYRSFHVKSMVSEYVLRFSILGTAKTVGHHHYGNRKGKTILMIACDGQDQDPRAVCEIALDDGMKKFGSGVIAHNCRINLNKKPMKKEVFIEKLKISGWPCNAMDGYANIFVMPTDRNLRKSEEIELLKSIIRYGIAVKGIKENARYDKTNLPLQGP